jgi:hypothetical protein
MESVTQCDDIPKISDNIFCETDPATLEDWSDCRFWFSTAWDDYYQYFFIDVWDDIIHQGTDLNFDSIELYWDADDSKTPGCYDGVDDCQLRINYGDMTADDLDFGFGLNLVDRGDDLRIGVQFAIRDTDYGYNLELAMPLANLQLTPCSPFGFEMQMNDADAGVRNSIRKWWSVDNNSWKDASLFGTAQLVGGGDIEPGVQHANDTTVPAHIVLSPSFPNPFNSITTVQYEITEHSWVRLGISNLQGQEIRNLYEGYLDAGCYQAKWDATDKFDNPVASGIYLICLECDGFSSIVKTVYTK